VNFEEMRRLIETETGMELGGDRAGRLRDAMAKALQTGRLPLANPTGLEGGTPQAWVERLTAELTIGETYFFRNERHFTALRNHVLPEIVRENAGKRQVRVWSAGCATGEEPYSVAILLDQLLSSALPWQVSILGTDINQAFLEKARRGLYRQWSFRQTDIHRNQRYFEPEQDAHRLAATIRERVHFAYLNLVKDVYPSPLTGTLGLDLILFRNVAIYLKPQVTQAIIERLRRALRPGGWLLLSETELNVVPQEGFETHHFDQATIYRKRGGNDIQLELPLMPAMPVLPLPAGMEPPPLPVWCPLPKRRAVAAAPSDWERIENDLKHRHFAEAERSIARIETVRERARVRLRYAQALLACAEQQRAKENLEVCLRDDPLLLEAHLLKASFAQESDDWNAAEQAYRQALYIDRKCPMAHFHLGLVQKQRGDESGAARSLRTTMKLIENQDPHALVEYGEGICFGRLKEMALSVLNPW
jgi:chemotaxis protein methyltransferase CheR